MASQELLDLRTMANPSDTNTSDEALQAAKTRVETNKSYRTHRAVNYLKTGSLFLEAAANALFQRAVDEGLVAELNECRKLVETLPIAQVSEVCLCRHGLWFLV